MEILDKPNLNSDRLIIVVYNPWAGGKFFVNALGLSNRAVLQHADYAAMQLDGKVNAWAKYDILKQRLDKTTTRWLDLGLGCSNLFGDNLKDPNSYPPLITRLSNNNHYFFVVAHNESIARSLTKTWPNAKIIYVCNSFNFVSWRFNHKTRRDVPLCSWFPNYQRLSEVDVDFSNFVYEFPHQKVTVDADVFLDKDKLLCCVKFLYQWLGLDDYNDILINDYYDFYMDKLREIRLVYEKNYVGNER